MLSRVFKPPEPKRSRGNYNGTQLDKRSQAYYYMHMYINITRLYIVDFHKMKEDINLQANLMQLNFR